MKKSIIEAIDLAILEIEKYITEYSLSKEDFLDFFKVLGLLREELLQKQEINERVLRGFKDICTTTAIQFEHTNFNDPIFEINNKLEKHLPKYSRLELLRMDFGKENPI
jgi:hypothetical protein